MSVACRVLKQDHPLMIYIVDYIKRNLLTYQVTVVSKSTKKLGSFGSSIVKLMIDEFSSVVIDSSVVEESLKMETSEKLKRQIAHQSTLKIGIVELLQQSDPLQELSNFLEVLIMYNKNVRGKSIIFLINGNGQSLKQFFELAWSKDFLDITVIEWITQESKKTFRPEDFVCHGIFIHTFDPFNEKYTKEILSQNTSILPDKLRDLRGYQLRANIYENGWLAEIDEDYSGTNELDRFHGDDIYRTKFLADALNFTTISKFIRYDEWMSCYQSVNNSCEYQCDFLSNSVMMNSISFDEDTINSMEWVEKFSSTSVHTFMLTGQRLYVIQEKIIETRISKNFYIACSSILTILLLFLFFFSRILRLNVSSWSTLKIFQALMGDAIGNQGEISLKEKIFSVTLYFTSIIMMTITSDELFNMSIDKRAVLRFKNLQELANSGESLHVTNDTRTQLLALGQHYHVLQKIADNSVASEINKPTLNNIPIDASSTSVYGAINEYSPQFFPVVGSLNKIWFANEIEEDIILNVDIMKVRENFPFKDRFEKILLRLIESGLLKHYSSREINLIIRRISWNSRYNSTIFYPHHARENDTYEETPLNERLIIVILTGYCLAWIALGYEIFFEKSHFSEIFRVTSKSDGSNSLTSQLSNLLRLRLIWKRKKFRDRLNKFSRHIHLMENTLE
ncbi:hypothetical protein QAD02_010916 [Eretmocerus hayati]|uniref:Uncharacterized protein n=1 Tax=Eretmocerus hayati TaxID=131215 RepID=A0ACC2NV72_9HYME|nr:hypothetical protein QAD02_010916 [Eretmocerus hayati]